MANSALSIELLNEVANMVKDMKLTIKPSDDQYYIFLHPDTYKDWEKNGLNMKYCIKSEYIYGPGSVPEEGPFRVTALF